MYRFASRLMLSLALAGCASTSRRSDTSETELAKKVRVGPTMRPPTGTGSAPTSPGASGSISSQADTPYARCPPIEAEFGEARSVRECTATGHRLFDVYFGCADMPPAYFDKDILGAQLRCVRRFLDAEIEVRARTVAADGPRLAGERRLQAEFEAAVDAFCVESDESATGEGTYACGASLTAYRAEQLAAINRRALEVTAPASQTPRVGKHFETFARGLCRMPTDVWKQRRPPGGCVQRVLREIVAAAAGTLVSEPAR